MVCHLSLWASSTRYLTSWGHTEYAWSTRFLRTPTSGGSRLHREAPAGRPTDDDSRICTVDSVSVRHGVEACGREVVSLARPVRPSRFVHLLSYLRLLLRRKRPKDGRGGRRRLGDITPVGIPVGESPAKSNLLYFGFSEAGPHHELSDAPRIGHGEGVGCLGVRRRNMPLRFQYPAHERESRVAVAGRPDGESQPTPRPQHAPAFRKSRRAVDHQHVGPAA